MFDHVEVLRDLSGDLDAALAGGFMLTDERAAVAAIEAFEVVRRKVAALGVALHTELDRSGSCRPDGHASAKAMVRHVARLSPAEAAARDRGARMGRLVPELGHALEQGSLGVAQYELLGRVHANPRVRTSMADAADWFLDRARRLPYRDFELAVRQWERLADADGPEPAKSRNHDNRTASLTQDFELSWKLMASFGALQGATMHDILEHYVAAERLADWEKARAEHGDDATEAHLERTEAQRRADALGQLFDDAAKAPGSAVPTDFVHSIVWDEATYEEMLRRLDGQPARPLDPQNSRCETVDGVPLEPTEAAASSLVGHVRRVVTDAAGVVIDLGRARRFTGSSRTAVQLSTRHCPWPGCTVPATRCETDHTLDHARGGRTDPTNGGPFCGRHNRWKQKHFTVWRDPIGEWHVYRRDGTEIT